MADAQAPAESSGKRVSDLFRSLTSSSSPLTDDKPLSGTRTVKEFFPSTSSTAPRPLSSSAPQPLSPSGLQSYSTAAPSAPQPQNLSAASPVSSSDPLPSRGADGADGADDADGADGADGAESLQEAENAKVVEGTEGATSADGAICASVDAKGSSAEVVGGATGAEVAVGDEVGGYEWVGGAEEMEVEDDAIEAEDSRDVAEADGARGARAAGKGKGDKGEDGADRVREGKAAQDAKGAKEAAKGAKEVKVKKGKGAFSTPLPSSSKTPSTPAGQKSITSFFGRNTEASGVADDLHSADRTVEKRLRGEAVGGQGGEAIDKRHKGTEGTGAEGPVVPRSLCEWESDWAWTEELDFKRSRKLSDLNQEPESRNNRSALSSESPVAGASVGSEPEDQASSSSAAHQLSFRDPSAQQLTAQELDEAWGGVPKGLVSQPQGLSFIAKAKDSGAVEYVGASRAARRSSTPEVETLKIEETILPGVERLDERGAMALSDRPGVRPPHYTDRWDEDHVRLPCSPRNTRNGAPRWEKIRESLWPRRRIRSFADLQTAVLGYFSVKTSVRSAFSSKSTSSTTTFKNLEIFLEQDLRIEQRNAFFEYTLPHMIRLALLLPDICPEPIPLLKSGVASEVHLNALQLACLLANAFLCTFPSSMTRDEAVSFPSINFNRLFEMTSPNHSRGRQYAEEKAAQNREKLRCLVHYFTRITERLNFSPEALAKPSLISTELSSRMVSFIRRILQKDNTWEWAASPEEFAADKLEIRADGTIEDIDSSGESWQADFANCVIGGGVLSNGCVQEEIRFVLSPELIVSRLLTERLGDHESLLMIGTERFCNYEGYASTFKFAGNHVDRCRRDSTGRFLTVVVAYDALYFGRDKYTRQFKKEKVGRELDKALCAFAPPSSVFLKEVILRNLSLPMDLASPPIATGNWGCGAFNGDPFLKAVIQILAAAKSGRSLMYLTFGDESLTKDIKEFYSLLVLKKQTVGDVYRALTCFRPYSTGGGPDGAGVELKNFLRQRFASEDLDDEEW